MSEEETFELVFLRENCNACGVCEESCPENCLQLVDQGSDQDRMEKGTSPSTPQHSAQALSSTRAQARGRKVDPQEDHSLGAAERTKVIFEDKISRCRECGTPLFPQAMVRRLESKLFLTEQEVWPFHLCPSCRMKSQFKNEII
jgi:ferredoxin